MNNIDHQNIILASGIIIGSFIGAASVAGGYYTIGAILAFL